MRIVKQTSTRLEMRDLDLFWLTLAVGGSLIGFGIMYGTGAAGGGLVGLLASVLGADLLISLLEISTLTLDKSSGLMMLKTQKLFRAKNVKYPIEAISGVEIQSIEGQHRICLLLESGKRSIPLSSGFKKNLGNPNHTANVISTFLGIQTQQQKRDAPIILEKPVWETPEAEIAHLEAAVQANPEAAEANLNLGIALYKYYRTSSRSKAMGYVKKAENLFKSQGYKQEAYRALTTHYEMFMGVGFGEPDIVIKQSDGTTLTIQSGTGLKVLESTAMRLTLQKPQEASEGAMLGCLFLVISMFTIPITLMGFLVLPSSLDQLLTNRDQTLGRLVELVLACLIGIGMAGVAPILFLILYEFAKRISTCRFDRTLGTMTIQRSGTLLSRLSRPTQCSLREIVDVQVEEKKVSSEDGSYMSYKAVLVLTSSKRISIPSESRNRAAWVQLSEFIKTFLYLNK